MKRRGIFLFLTNVINPLLFATRAPIKSSSPSATTAIELIAERTVLRADGRSTTVLTARIFNDRGQPIADGTHIQFATTSGRLDSLIAEARGGVARVTLTAPEQAGTATVTANIENGVATIPARIQLTFSNDAAVKAPMDRWIRIENAGYIGYIFGIPGNQSKYVYAEDANGLATLQLYGVKMTARRFIIDTLRRYMIAEDVRLSKNGEEKIFKRFRFDFTTNSGYAERIVGFRTQQSIVDFPLLEEKILNSDEPVMSRDSWTIPDLSQAQMTVVANAITLDFETSLQFRNAVFYISGQKAYSARYHVMSPQQSALYREQLIGIGANGMWLNLPYYFNVRTDGVGTFFLRRGGQFGSSVYSQRQGWTADLDQSYSSHRGTEGLFQIINIARDDRGYRLQHNQKIDSKTDANLFADVIRGKDVFGSSQLGHNFTKFRYTVSTAMNRYQGITDTSGGTATAIPASGDWRVQNAIETYPRLFSKHSTVRYTVTSSRTDQHFWGVNNQRGPIQTENVGTRLYVNPIKIGNQMSITQSGVLGYTWVKAPSTTTGIGSSGPSYQTTTSLSRPVRWHNENLGNAQISYDYVQTPPIFLTANQAVQTPGQIPSYVRQGRQRIGFTSYIAKEERWGLSFNGSRGIDTTQSTLYSEGRVSLGGPWATRVRLTQTKVTGFGYQDVEYALIRTVNNRDVSLYYSTIAKRFQLDLTGLSF